MSENEEQSPSSAEILLLAALYFLGAKLGVVLTIMPEGMAIVWPPNGVVLAAFIRFRRRLFLAAPLLLAEIAADQPSFTIGEAILFGLINLGEATLASWLLARCGFHPRFKELTDLTKFTLCAPVLSAFAASWPGALVYATLRPGDTSYFELVRNWWFGDALGLMIVTPLALAWWYRTSERAPDARSFSLSDGLAGVAAIATAVLLFWAQDGRLFAIHVGPVLLLPFVLFVAARFSLLSTAAATAATALVILTLTANGNNPFGRASPRDAVIHAQEFIFIMCLLALGLASLLDQLRRGKRELELANRELSKRADELVTSNREILRAEAEVVALNERLELRVRERTRDLEEALAQVNRLQGLLPICAWCKKVRDDKDYWHSVEDYISTRSEARFSHGICPDCFAKALASMNEFDNDPYANDG